MTCSICDHPRVAEIHAMYVSTGKVNATAAAFELPKTTWKRHIASGHVPTMPAVAPESLVVSTPEPEPIPPTLPPPAPVVVEAEPDDEDDRPIKRKPGHPCGVCSLPRDVRMAVNAAITSGEESYGAVVKKYNLPIERRAVRHHQNVCMPRVVRTAQAEEAAIIVRSVRERAESLMDRAEALVAKAEVLIDLGEDEEADLRARATCVNATANALNTAKGFAETLGKLTGEIGPDVQINLLGSPQWQTINDLIWRHFGNHPAFQAFVADLSTMDAKPAPLQLTA